MPESCCEPAVGGDKEENEPDMGRPDKLGERTVGSLVTNLQNAAIYVGRNRDKS